MPKAVLFIGLPGAGKSSLINKEFRKDYTIVSADDIKISIKGYDPLRPDIVHEESVKQAEEMMYELADQGKDICMDSGGVNNSYSIRIIKTLRAKGYYVKLIYVDTPLAVCLERNKRRERLVPEKEIIEKSMKIESCFFKQREICDEVEVREYFSNKNVFLDMDGCLAEYQTITPYESAVDYVNSGIFKRSLPVTPVINTLREAFKNSSFYILSVSPNSICNEEKKEWLKIHAPFIPESNYFFVGRPDKKVTTLLQLLKKLKIHTRDCMYIDDMHSMIKDATNAKINALHPSKLLARYYKESSVLTPVLEK